MGGKKERERKKVHKSNKKDKHFIFRPIIKGDIVKEDTIMILVAEKHYSHLVTGKTPEETIYAGPSIFPHGSCSNTCN